MQVIRFSGGDGVAVEPVSYGTIRGATPDLRMACASIPPAASLIVVEDATRDARLVIPSDARFFAFARAETVLGHAVGALCLLDSEPQRLSPYQTEQLTDLAALVTEVLVPRPDPALADAEARFQALSEVVFDALLITDDGVILDANDQAVALLGVSDAEVLIGQHLAHLVPERIAPAVQARASQAGQFTAAILRPDGHEVPILVQARTFPHDGRLLRVAAFRAESL